MSPLRWVFLLLLMSASVWLALSIYRPGLANYAQRQAAPAALPGDQLTATWLGVSAVLLRAGDDAVLIDPFFTRPPGLLPMMFNRPIQPDEARISQWLQRLDLRRLDAVLVSHSHFDHAMDAGVVARMTGARLIGSESTLNIGRGAGLSSSLLHRVEPQQAIEAGPFRVTFFASRHAGATGGRPLGEIEVPLPTPAKYLDYRLGGTYSILVEHAQGTVLHHGSAGFEPGMLADVRAGTVFLGVALIDELEPYLQQTVDAVGARVVVPVHWDDFTRPLDQPLRSFPLAVDLDEFFEDMARTRPQVQVMTLGLAQPTDLFLRKP